MFKWSNNNNFWALVLERKWAHTKKEKNLLPQLGTTPRPPEQITGALPSELQGPMGAGPAGRQTDRQTDRQIDS